MTNTFKSEDWTPVKMESVYCSPACGCGCRLDDHNKAVDRAAKLTASLRGDWRPRVWENMGWHGEAIFENEEHDFIIKVSESRGGIYWCHLNAPKQIVAESNDPQAAVDTAIAEYKLHIEKMKNIEDVLSTLEEI